MITASLVSGADPRLVQIVVDETPAGEPWKVIGRVGGYTPGLLPSDFLLPSEDLLPSDETFTPGEYQWDVPGGFGIGDGEQVALVDNRSPGNVTAVYYLVTASSVSSSSPVVVPFPNDVVLQSSNGQQKISAPLLEGSTDLDLPTSVSLFRIPGRERPVSRFDVVGDASGSRLNILLPLSEKRPFRDLLGPGGPVLCRLGVEVADLDPVFVMQVTKVNSSLVLPRAGLRLWSLEYTIVDDPWAEERIGAFTWGDVAEAFAGRTWVDFREAFAGKTWNDFATTDWTVI